MVSLPVTRCLCRIKGAVAQLLRIFTVYCTKSHHAAQMCVIGLFKMTLGLFIINIIERRDGFTHFIFLDYQKNLKIKKVVTISNL